MVRVTLKDSSVVNVKKGTGVFELAGMLGAGLAKAACAARIDGEVRDLRSEINEDCAVEILTFDDKDGSKAFWHTASHLLAHAVLELFPGAKYAIGPAIDNGFYYDFDVERPFGPDDLVKIEAKMQKLAALGEAPVRFELPAEQALELMKGQPYKLELIRELEGQGEQISFYKTGGFTDLCVGPHLMSTAPIKAIKLLSSTGAYWRGSEKNKMLSRIYGTAFPKKSMLDEYLQRLEEAKKRDHRKLGRELEIFALMDEAPGFPFFLPNGMIIKNKLIEYWREVHTRAGYVEISTPMILSRSLWERSGHWYHYKDNMYTTVIDDEDFAIKPMNCPGGFLVYKSGLHSYRELPMRVGELGVVHRHELSGALHGLMRVRCFTQDDAHIFMTKEQIKDEIKGVVNLIDEVYSLFGFSYHIELSTMPEEHMGEKEDWDTATDALKAAMQELGRSYIVNEGDGAFYGPKLDFHLEDSIGRTWQCGTIQLDYQMPERFDLEYTGSDGEKHRPVMIHRVVFGSIERFIGILIEHFAGAFPLWLAPVQAVVLPITQNQLGYAQEVLDKLKQAGLRASVDGRSEKIGYKIREAQLKKIPYMLVVGEKEAASQTVAIRKRSGADLGAMDIDNFIADALSEIDAKAL